MDLVKRLIYGSLATAIRAYQKLFLDLHVWGREHISMGPKIYAQNHVTSTDPYWVLPLLPEPVHVIIGPGYQSRAVGWLLDHFEQINAMPNARKSVVDKAVMYLRRGGSIYTAPEGDIQEPFMLGHFYPGVARIYRRTGVPIIPIALVAPKRCMWEVPRLQINVEGRIFRAVMVLRGTFCVRFGKPFTPEIRDDIAEEEDNERIMNELKEEMQRLIDDTRYEKFWQ